MSAWETTPSSETAKMGHKILLENRQTLQITGADDVISFDGNTVVLHTVMGVMSIDGSELHILQLNTRGGDGTMVVCGKIDGVFYVDEEAPRTKKLFGKRER